MKESYFPRGEGERKRKSDDLLYSRGKREKIQLMRNRNHFARHVPRKGEEGRRNSAVFSREVEVNGDLGGK